MDLKQHLSRITPDDREFREAFEQATVSKPDYARYYLRTLERTKAKEKEPWSLPNEDPTEITLEHVLPKTPNLGEWAAFDPDAVRKYSRRLGNMCLLQKTPNSNARSDEFLEKRALYGASPYFLTNELARFETWGPQEIEARQRDMARLAVHAWPI